MNEALPCVVCKKKLECAINGFPEQPSNGLVFYSAGNFGSKIFDGEVGELFLSICEDCIKTLSEQNHLGHKIVTNSQTITLKFAQF